jgi:adenylate cyclase
MRPLRLLVLPFEDVGVSPDGVFAAGLTLHVITRLVARRHKHLLLVFSLRKHDLRNVHQISKELHANYVLTGSVLRSDGQIRVDVELIDQTDQSCIWAETYTRAQSDSIVTQDEIAQHLSRSLVRILPHGEPASLGQQVISAD